jgi:hypothetical protein
LKKLLIPWLVLTLSCLTSCGLTLGPQTKVEIVIPHAGKPCRVVQKKAVLDVQEIKSGLIAPQDVAGWICMPEEHWDAVQRAMDAKDAEIKTLKSVK